jgi:hypothetical protein
MVHRGGDLAGEMHKNFYVEENEERERNQSNLISNSLGALMYVQVQKLLSK